ncbi:hypothetical protein ACOZ4N_01140 (plasmid) [Halorientalis pallida]|uniref:hypothetical protein n=1 Tax=Halorientalis pallida TaxID=2479928 RepID=UPI003C6EC347
MSTSDQPLIGRIGDALARTRAATGLVVRRRDSQLVFATVTLLYLVLYLWAIGHLAAGLGGFDVLVVSDPLSKLLQPELGPFSFTPVARVTAGPVTYLFSLNTILGLGIALLVGLNVGLTYLVWRQPSACGIGRSSTGFLASIPALLSGTACCGPVVLIVLGVQASGVLLTGFQLLLPLAVAVLLGSLVLVGRQVTVQG